ncbi:hypothetical protein V8B97DRAFT_2042463 [Scleroderma yunnanense]
MLIGDVLRTSFSSAMKKRYTRVTLSYTTLCFFLLALVTCVVQSTLEGLVLSHSMKARIFVTDIIDVAGVQRGFTTVDNDVLEICYGIPGAHGTTCEVVYNGTVVDETAVAPDNSTALSRRGASITPFVNGTGSVQGVTINLTSSSSPIALSLECVMSLTWLETFLRNSKSEDVVYIIFQCWLLSVSLAALIMESIPHSTVVLASHGTNTAWTLLRLVTDRGAEKIYRNVVVAEACQGVDVLGGWPDDSIHYAIIGINGGVFLCMAFLVYNLVKAYGRAVYSSVGSSPAVSRILRLMHWFTVFLQFASFYTVASAAAWFDKRKTDIVSPYSHSTLQDVAFIVTAVLLLPWFLLGIHCIRLEHRLLFFLFALSSLILLGISGLLFSSALYRYELTVWRFFGALSAVADFLLLVTCVLAVVCRTRFGLGLKQFLDVQTELQKSGFAQDRFALDPNCDTATTISITTPTLLAHKIKELGSVQSTSPASTPTNRHSSGSTCSVQSETFGTWLMATDKYGMPDKETASGTGVWTLPNSCFAVADF